MPVSTTVSQEERTISEENTREHPMFEREGFQQRQLRYDFSTVTNISLDDEYVERDEKTFIDPETLDLPAGPLGAGEVGGSGVDVLRMDGERWDTYRFGAGFTLHQESDDQRVSTQEQAVMEMFQFYGDVAFLHGLNLSAGHLGTGVFDWLRNNVPSDRTFDLENYDGDGTGSSSPDLTGQEEELFGYHAMEAVGAPRVLDMDAGWDTIIGAPEAINRIRGKIGDYQGGETRRTYWDRIADDAGLVNDTMRVPYKLQPATLPKDLQANLEEPIEIPLVDQGTAVNPSSAPMGYDEAFVIPDMDTVASEFWELYEMGTPEGRGPIEGRDLKDHYDYAWRYTHRFNQGGRHPNATDVIHLKNVSQLFD